jgi:hypothetical protein
VPTAGEKRRASAPSPMHVPAPVLTFTGRRSAGDFVLAKILELQWKF